jgi:hypothetical protein
MVLQHDPYETHNLFKAHHSSAFDFPSLKHREARRTTLQHLISRLDSLVMVLKTCKARSCTHPWEVLHPAGNVNGLHDALDICYDDFYELRQERVRYEKCEKGYILDSEGPHHVKAFSADDIEVRGGSLWSELV